MQFATRFKQRVTGPGGAGPCLKGKMQLQVEQQQVVRALNLDQRTATRLFQMAASGARQSRQHQSLQTSQRSSLQATCLLRHPLLTGMRQPAFSSRQHTLSCPQRLMLSRAKSRLLSSRIRVPQCSRKAPQMHRRRRRQVRSGSRKQQGARRPRRRVQICKQSPAPAAVAHPQQTAPHGGLSKSRQQRQQRFQQKEQAQSLLHSLTRLSRPYTGSPRLG